MIIIISAFQTNILEYPKLVTEIINIELYNTRFPTFLIRKMSILAFHGKAIPGGDGRIY